MAHHIVLGIFVVVLLAAAAVAPDLFRRWMQEDAWAEWATFFAFALAAVLAWTAVRRRLATSRARRFALLFGAACLFAAGEEISWGQRLFGFAPPEAFLRHSHQLEFNLHNLGGAGPRTRWAVAALAAAYGVLWPVVAWRFRQAWLMALAPARSFVPWFGLVALTELAYPFELSGEAAELLLGLAVLAEFRRRDSGGSPAGWLVAAVALGIATPPLVDRVSSARHPGAARQAEAELTNLAMDLARPGGLSRSIFDQPHAIHQRLDSARDRGYLTLPGREEARDRHALDPWGNPYWLWSSSNQRMLVLYSFGPNRRRDTDFGTPDSGAHSQRFEALRRARRAGRLEGDDLGAILLLAPQVERPAGG